MHVSNLKKLFLVLAGATLLAFWSCKLEDSIEINFNGVSAALLVGEDMTVQAETSEPVESYQWFLNGVPLWGETEAALTIGSKLEPADYRLELLVKTDDKIGRNGFNFSVAGQSAAIAKWARTGVGGGSAFFNTATAADGSVYCVGWVSGSIDFGNGVTVTGTGTRENILLVKYDRSGRAKWAKTMVGGDGLSIFSAVSAASDGSVYAAGYINGRAPYDLGDGVSTTGMYSIQNMLLVKYDRNGTVLWAKTMVAAGNASSLSSVSVASDGSVFAAGVISGNDPFDFGDGVTATVEGYAPMSVLLVKYASDGTVLWARTVVKGFDDSVFNSITTAPDGSVYAAGHISPLAGFDFGNGVTVSPPGLTEDLLILLVKYDRDGNALWGKTIANLSGRSEFYGVSASSDGSVYAVGSIRGTAAFDFGNNVTATGSSSEENMVLVKYDREGLAQWARTAVAEKDNSLSILLRVAAATNDSVYAVGYMSYISGASYDFGNGVTLAADNLYGNPLLIKYDGAGMAQWVRTAISGDEMSMSDFVGVSAAPNGSVYSAGTAVGTLDFGNNVTLTESMGALLVKYR